MQPNRKKADYSKSARNELQFTYPCRIFLTFACLHSLAKSIICRKAELDRSYLTVHVYQEGERNSKFKGFERKLYSYLLLSKNVANSVLYSLPLSVNIWKAIIDFKVIKRFS